MKKGSFRWEPLNININNSGQGDLESHCCLVVNVSGYRFRGPGSIPGATTFSEK
jgi:hypothetical protein